MRSEADHDPRAQLAGRVAAVIDRLGLQVPAVWFLQTLKPLSFLGSQIMWVLQPLAVVLDGEEALGEYARFLEDGEGIEMILRRLDQDESLSV